MEVTWLLALVSIPIYFNIYTSRVFEPDKISLFRSLVLVMLTAWAGKGLARLAAEPEGRVGQRKNFAARTDIIYPPDGEVIGPDSRPFPWNILRRPLILFVFFLGFAYALATVFSITPEVSWWGSYQRLQGTYSFFSYVVFFLVIAFNMRERRQVERLISFVLLANIPVALYGMLQHLKADPLPWQGDVVFRVTSSMGNAIFISAYLIMVVPLVLYRLVTTGRWLLQNRTQSAKYFKGRNRDTALSWAALYGGFIIFLVGLFFAVLNFSANYRPESSGVAFASDAPRLTSDTTAAESRSLVGGESIGPWWALPVGITLSFGLFFLFTVRRRGTDNNYLFRLFEFASYIALITVVVLTILYSQSRGPEAGIIFGVVVFFPVLFWRRRMWKWLVGWGATAVILGTLFVLFNLPQGSTPLEPAFKVLRQNEQIARLGQFFETSDGTGRVRQLIWKTVLEAMGDAAQNEPGRLIVGYGPETLYNISPKHYQPELGQLEARNAIPDRSHNGYLDALVNTGVIGLVTYVALVLAFLYYAFKFLRRTERFEYQVLLTALISIMLSHQLEIQTGIQIVSTWMMFWTSAALLMVMGGLVYGRWDAIGAKAAAENSQPVTEPLVTEVAPEPVMVAKNEAVKPPRKAPAVASATIKAASKEKEPARSKAPNRIREKEVVRESPARGGTARPVAAATRRGGPVYATAYTEAEYLANEQPVRVWYWAALGVISLLALMLAWFGNLLPIWADTIYKQGSNLAQVQQWRRAAPYFEQASIYAPREDFYALYTGQSYLEIARSLVKEASTDRTKQLSMLEYLRASERELIRATKLSPLNPDHYANLGRLYGGWADLEPARATELLKMSIDRYQQAVGDYAPRNSRLWGELAAAQASLATNRYDPEISGTPVDQAMIQQAIASGEKAVALDPKYDYARNILGDIFRFAGRINEAGAQYLALGEIDPKQVGGDPRFPRRIQAMATSPLVPFDKALSLFDPQSKTTTDKGYAYLGRGMLFYYKNNLDEARSALFEASKLSATDPFSHAFLALIYRRTGQANLAEAEAAQARELAGKSPSGPQLVSSAIENLLKG